MNIKLNKENSVKATIISENPIKNLNSWHRIKDCGQYLVNDGEICYDITAKEEIQFVYDVYYNPFYHMFVIDKAYTPSEVAEFIEVFYSNLPDERDVKFIITTNKIESHYIYYTDDEIVVGVYDKLTDIINDKFDVTDKYIYSVDWTQQLFRVNEECEGVKELIMEAIYEE
jgi:hypothetical protein